MRDCAAKRRPEAVRLNSSGDANGDATVVMVVVMMVVVVVVMVMVVILGHDHGLFVGGSISGRPLVLGL